MWNRETALSSLLSLPLKKSSQNFTVNVLLPCRCYIYHNLLRLASKVTHNLNKINLIHHRPSFAEIGPQLQNCSSPEKFVLTDRRATVSPIVKTVYLLRTKSCERFGLNFSIILLCQVKIPDEKNSKHVYLLVKNINKPLVHFYQPLSA